MVSIVYNLCRTMFIFVLNHFNLYLHPKNIFIKFILLFLLFLKVNTISAQQYALINTFTTADGLPSNHVYETVQDSIGFLWIATDNGVSRYDGKYFKNFTVRDGLPSNDVIQITITPNGTLWANSFRQMPSYFDYKTNRFVTPPCTQKTKEYCNQLITVFDASQDTIQYVAHNLNFYVTTQALNSIYDKEGGLQLLGMANLNLMLNASSQEFSLANRNRLIDKHRNNIIFSTQAYFYKFIKNKTNLYASEFNGNSILKIDIGNFQKIKSTVVTCNGLTRTLTNADGVLLQVLNNGQLNVYNSNTMQLVNTTNTSKDAQNACIDRFKNIWISSATGGLSRYALHPIFRIVLPAKFKNEAVLSVTHIGNKIVTGTSAGNVFEIKNDKIKVHHIQDNMQAVWNHKILPVGKKMFTMINTNYNIDFGINRNIASLDNIVTQLKCATAINDSIVFIGAINGGTLLNVNTYEYKKLPNNESRILAVCKRNANSVYYIKSNGLFKDDIYNTHPAQIKNIDCEANEWPTLVSAIDTSWQVIATNYDNLVVFKNEKPILKILQEKGLFEGIKKIVFYESKIIVASKTGIAVVSLPLNNNTTYSIQHITKADGLPSNNVNDMDVLNNELLVATEAGLVKMPIAIAGTSAPIIPAITAVMVNNKMLSLQNTYTLQANQRNVNINISGVDISGHFKNMYYAIGDTIVWQVLESNFLNAQLDFGTTPIYFKGINTNGIVSDKIRSVQFYIATPFYRTFWFWILVGTVATSFFLVLYNRRKLAQQKILFDKQTALEMQRQNITADLHDDVGATLSSLQLNSTIAKRLLKSDVAKSNDVMQIIETQAKELSEKLSDIIWSMKPSDQAFGNFSDRIKTYASQILDNSDMAYTINIDDAIDGYIKDVIVKKDLIFVCKEAINNAVKYSKANVVHISALIINTNIVLNINDDGIGFNATESKGNGLNNMQKRMQEIGGQINICTEVNKGTQIEIKLPTTRFRG
jgi:signal transduction histidine kinase